MYKLDFSKVDKDTKGFFLFEAECHDWVVYDRSLKAWTFKREHLKSIKSWIDVLDKRIKVIEIN